MRKSGSIDGVRATERLRRFLAEHPNPGGTYSLADIGREIRASREFVRRALPGYHEKHLMELERAQLTQLWALKREQRTLVRDGAWTVSYAKIAAATGLDKRLVSELSATLGIRGNWTRRPDLGEQRRHKLAARAARLQETLWVEHCRWCGRAFDWTVMNERRWRLEGKRVACSRSCGQQMRRASERQSVKPKKAQER